MATPVTSSLAEAVSAALVACGVPDPGPVQLEQPARREHGDWSTNAALGWAKAAGRKPRDLATELVVRLDANRPAHVTRIEIAGPGFINFHLADTWLHDVLTTVIADGVAGYARPDIGHGKTVNVEYVSANPTGPLHAGHARWAAYGDALTRVMARSGYVVHREFYVNDRGVQTVKYALSLVARRWGLEPPEGMYLGVYITEWAKEMPLDDNPLEWGLAKALTYQRETLARMHVEFDTWSSERAVARSGAVEATLAELRATGYVYESAGGHHDDDTAKGTATWLRTTHFGDSDDRVLVKADGQYTYYTPDIAYHCDKFSRGALLIDILGADHHGYVGRMQAAMQCLGRAADDLEVIIGQNCVLLRGGAEVKLSKRTGDIIELAEIIDEVGPDVAKLTFLLQSVDTRQMFDLEVLKDTKADHPVHYVHYAHARVYGIGREAKERGISRRPLDSVDLGHLAHERELAVIRSLSELPDVVATACRDRAPHKVTTWVRELATAFQGFYHDCPILRDDVADELRQARLWLVEAARIGLVIGLTELLGVSAPERM